MEVSADAKDVRIRQPLFKIPFNFLAIITVSLPAVSLAVCFIYSMIFQFEDVNFTMCEVCPVCFGSRIVINLFATVLVMPVERCVKQARSEGQRRGHGPQIGKIKKIC